MSSFTTTFVFPIGKTLGGANIWSARMLGYLERAGCPTAAVLHTNPGWHPDGNLPIPEPTRIISCGGPTVVNARTRHVRAFARAYAGCLPSIVIPNWHDTCYAACAELAKTRAADLRVVGVVHGNNESYYGPLTYYESIMHGFIAVSDEIAIELKRRLPHRGADIHTMACPVEVEERLARPDRAPGAPLVITYAGRITNHEKKVSDLTPLMKELDQRGVDFKFRIIGEGGYLPTLKWEVQQLPGQIQKRVSIEGLYPPDAMPGVWRVSDICILVSSSEGTSISMLEAMAAGCVPVVTRVSGTAAVISEGVNGCTAPVGDVAGLAAHIQRLASQPDVWATMSRSAHATAKSRYAYPDYAAWFREQLLRWQAAEPRPWSGRRPVLRNTRAWPAWLNWLKRRCSSAGTV
jgi:glycosyltransferase involved in cell wall biosynthesis